MVQGIELFSEFFKEHRASYVLIGGAACDLWLADVELEFRTTKDLDIVLVLESLDREFVVRFNQFVREGKYKNRQKSTGKHQHYRFFDPQSSLYPSMLELFSRQPEGAIFSADQTIGPIPTEDDLSSLSAILMDEDYYKLLLDERRSIQNVTAISPAGLVCLKMHAWLDISKRIQDGEKIDSEDAKKHKNDVYRLFFALQENTTMSIPLIIKKDVAAFLAAIESDPWDIKNLGKKIGVTVPPASEIVIESLARIFRV